MHDSFQTHAYKSGMHKLNLNYACMQTVAQGQHNELHEDVYVLRCDSPHDTFEDNDPACLLVPIGKNWASGGMEAGTHNQREGSV